MKHFSITLASLLATAVTVHITPFVDLLVASALPTAPLLAKARVRSRLRNYNTFARDLQFVFAVLCLGMFLGVRPSAAQTAAPSTYNAYTGTDIKAIPPAPALGAANSVITDPTFGSRILRVTDANTKGGESFISTDSGFSRAWNANSTAIKLTGPSGDGYWLEFNPSTFQAGTGSNEPAPHPLSFGATWEWSAVEPNIIYYLSGSTIETYNTATGASTPLASTPTGDPVTYMAAVIGFDNWVCAAAGAGSQDTYTKIFCVSPSNPATYKFIDVVNKTINGVAQSSTNWPTSAAGETIGIHDISGGTGPNWLEVTFHQQSWGANGGAVLDLSANTWSLVTNADPYWSGHVSMGNGKYENSSGSTNGDDSRGTVLRNPDNLMNSSEYLFVMQPPAPVNNWCDADHSSWLNSLTNPNAPILDSRYSASTACQYAWADEIVAAAVDGSNTVWRFAHNFNGGSQCYYAQAFAQISNDGNWALFSSYWGASLGPDTSFGCTTRIDTFIVDLKDATGPSSSASTSSSGTTSSTTTSSSSTTSTSTSSSTSAVTTTITQSSNSAITYSPGWYTVSNSAFSGGSAVEAMNAGSTATFTFTGVAVRWIGYEDQWSGIATVSLDGQPQTTVDTYSSPAKAQTVVWGASGLSNTTHTITITVSGAMDSPSAGEWVWLNAFAVDIPVATTPPATTTTVLYQQNSSAVQYSGTWDPNSGSFNSGGSAVLAMNAGSQAKFTFTGTGVNWIGFSDPWSGIAQVYLDGTLVTTVDTYSAIQKAQSTQYSVSGLTNGTHTLTIVVTGTRDAKSDGDWVWVDAFELTQITTSGAAVVAGTTNLILDGDVIRR